MNVSICGWIMTSVVKADLVTFPVDEDADVGAFVLRLFTLASVNRY